MAITPITKRDTVTCTVITLIGRCTTDTLIVYVTRSLEHECLQKRHIAFKNVFRNSHKTQNKVTLRIF